jgi:hypothetical protein
VRKAAAGVAALFAIALFALRPTSARGPLPADTRALGARIAAHPTDWVAASALTERALDAPVRDPTALWRASSALAVSLAPTLAAPRSSIARGAFFHWNELSDSERKAVLETYAPALRDEMTFLRMYPLIYALTGDLDYLRRLQPHTPNRMRLLAGLAGTYGRYDQYRDMRNELERVDPQQPEIPPYGLDGWSGTCGENICRSAWRAVDAEHEIEIGIKTIDTDDVSPYVEIYVDGARRAEGAVGGEQTFRVPVDVSGRHRVEVRLANPIDRNGVPRRVRITALQPS